MDKIEERKVKEQKEKKAKQDKEQKLASTQKKA